ncbi:hypothetical protein ACFLZB_04150 [Nanoarchaeota archaeon]
MEIKQNQSKEFYHKESDELVSLCQGCTHPYNEVSGITPAIRRDADSNLYCSLSQNTCSVLEEALNLDSGLNKGVVKTKKKPKSEEVTERGPPKDPIVWVKVYHTLVEKDDRKEPRR